MLRSMLNSAHKQAGMLESDGSATSPPGQNAAVLTRNEIRAPHASLAKPAKVALGQVIDKASSVALRERMG